MEIVTGSTGEVHVTSIDDAVRNSNVGYLNSRVVLTVYQNFAATAVTNNEVRINSGYGINQGRIFKIDNNEWDSVTIENGSQGYKRADLIVARYTMNTQSGFEDISLVAIRGTSGSAYTDPSYTTGNINSGATQDDMPLYRVKLDGLNIVAVERMFTLVRDGGRLGELEKKVTDHVNKFNSINIRTNLASESTVYPKDVNDVRPGVQGTLPASHGGTGQTTLQNAANSLIESLETNETTPANGDYIICTTPSKTGYQRKTLNALWNWLSPKITDRGYGDMSKNDFTVGGNSLIVKPAAGGTGQTSLNATRNALGLGNDVTKVLQIPNGGTGLAASPKILTNLSSETETTVLQSTPRPGIMGTLPINHGGTGATSAANARTNLDVAKTNHASSATTFGVGNGSNFGHLKIKDNPGLSDDAVNGVAASGFCVYQLKKMIDAELSEKMPKTGGKFTGDVTFDKEGSSTSENWTRLYVGNSKISGTAGNQTGVLTLYAANGKRVDLAPNSSSVQGTIRLPSKTGTLATMADVEAAEADAKVYAVDQANTRMPKTGGKFTGDVTVDRNDGTTSSVGTSCMILGNAKSLGTAGNSEGVLRLFSEAGTSGGYAEIKAAAGTVIPRTIRLPNASGVIALNSQLDSYMPKSGGTFTNNIGVSQSAANTDGTIFTECTTSGNYARVRIGKSDGTNHGQVRIYSYGGSGYYYNIQVPNNLTASKVGTFPSTTGQITVSGASSRRVKENIRELTEEDAKKLFDIDVIRYDYKEFWNEGLKNQTGVIAEDVVNLIPEAVSIDKTYDPDKPIDEETNFPPVVDYSKFVPYLIKMVQMQQKEIEELKAKLS